MSSSEEQSSVISSSKCLYVWFSMLSILSARNLPELYVGMMTDTKPSIIAFFVLLCKDSAKEWNGKIKFLFLRELKWHIVICRLIRVKKRERVWNQVYYQYLCRDYGQENTFYNYRSGIIDDIVVYRAFAEEHWIGKRL